MAEESYETAKKFLEFKRQKLEIYRTQLEEVREKALAVASVRNTMHSELKTMYSRATGPITKKDVESSPRLMKLRGQEKRDLILLANEIRGKSLKRKIFCTDFMQFTEGQAKTKAVSALFPNSIYTLLNIYTDVIDKAREAYVSDALSYCKREIMGLEAAKIITPNSIWPPSRDYLSLVFDEYTAPPEKGQKKRYYANNRFKEADKIQNSCLSLWVKGKDFSSIIDPFLDGVYLIDAIAMMIGGFSDSMEKIAKNLKFARQGAAAKADAGMIAPAGATGKGEGTTKRATDDDISAKLAEMDDPTIGEHSVAPDPRKKAMLGWTMDTSEKKKVRKKKNRKA